MFSQTFTSCHSSLNLLKSGEQGTVTYFRNSDENTIKKLMAMGVTPGCSILLEQRFPAFVIRAGRTRLALDEAIARSVYVRLKE